MMNLTMIKMMTNNIEISYYRLLSLLLCLQLDYLGILTNINKLKIKTILFIILLLISL